jgi:hypothetical protein
MSGCNHRWGEEPSYLMVKAKFCTSCKRFDVGLLSETVTELRAEVERLTEELERLRGAS